MRPARKPLPLIEAQARIADLSQDGRGIARQDGGKVVFVAGALPGEQVRYRLTRRGKDADEGQVIQVLEASPERVAPACPHFGLCGGCSLQHLSPGAQILFKQKQLLDALERIGKVAPAQVAPPLAGPVWGYRRRARLAAKHVPKKGGVLVGFRERETPLVAAIDSCEVLDARVGRKLTVLAELVMSLSIRDRVPQIEVATADHVALVFRVLAPPSDEDRQKLADFAAREGFEIFLQTGGLDTVAPLVPPARELAYSPDGAARVAFRPTDFVQVNAGLNERMVAQALDWLAPRPGDRVLELFAGLGNFTLPLARTGAQVTAVEGEAALVARGRANAQANGLEVRYEAADLFNADPKAPWLAAGYDLALLDPPRAGAREMLPALAACRSLRRIVYVSCHPGTLARDAGILVQEHGFALARAGVLDMFPHTAHVESMALFERS